MLALRIVRRGVGVAQLQRLCVAIGGLGADAARLRADAARRLDSAARYGLLRSRFPSIAQLVIFLFSRSVLSSSSSSSGAPDKRVFMLFENENDS